MTLHTRPVRKPYVEGDWFAMPAGRNREAIGRVARVGKRGLLLVYLFPPQESDDPSVLEKLRPERAIWVTLTGDPGLLEGRWRVLGQVEWDRSAWPVPDFVREEAITGHVLRVLRDDSLQVVEEKRVATEELNLLYKDGVVGHILAEQRVAQLVS